MLVSEINPPTAYASTVRYGGFTNADSPQDIELTERNEQISTFSASVTTDNAKTGPAVVVVPATPAGSVQSAATVRKNISSEQALDVYVVPKSRSASDAKPPPDHFLTSSSSRASVDGAAEPGLLAKPESSTGQNTPASQRNTAVITAEEQNTPVTVRKAAVETTAVVYSTPETRKKSAASVPPPTIPRAKHEYMTNNADYHRVCPDNYLFLFCLQKLLLFFNLETVLFI